MMTTRLTVTLVFLSALAACGGGGGGGATEAVEETCQALEEGNFSTMQEGSYALEDEGVKGDLADAASRLAPVAEWSDGHGYSVLANGQPREANVAVAVDALDSAWSICQDQVSDFPPDSSRAYQDQLDLVSEAAGLRYDDSVSQ